MSSFSNSQSCVRVILPTFLLLLVSICVSAQSAVVAVDTGNADSVQRRIQRARGLAAAHQLDAAASELESLRASANDVALRNVTSVMLLGIYLEEANYVRSQAILEETFQARSARKDDSIRTYFAMAGQAINGVRSHMARYRSFGINPSDADLPPESVTDLDRLRSLLERMAAQARDITNENVRAYDALALQEDVLGIRLSLARDAEDREKWEGEYAAAREQLAAAQVKIASIGRIPPGAAAPRIARSTPSESPSPINNETGSSSTEPATITATPPSSPPSQPSVEPARPESKDLEPRTIKTGALNGREKKHVTPAYPATAKTTRASGVVKVYVIVDEKGKVTVTNSEGPALLRQAAETAAQGWRFLPTVFDGKPVRISGYISFEFKL